MEIINEQDSDLAPSASKMKLNDITLEEYFKDIVEGNCIEFDSEDLNNILKKDLQINFYYLKPKLKNVIPYMLFYFIKSWPGWQKNQKYLKKQISINSWFIKFKEYLVFKINYLIKNDYEKVLLMMKANPSIDDNVLFKIDNSTQTDIPSEKCVASYSIEIQASPKMLNSLIFCDGPKDSVVIREYKTDPLSENLTVTQLLNWPSVEIQFVSKELHFMRKNVHEFKRFLMLSNEKIIFKNKEIFIEEIEIVDEKLNRTVYTLNALREYCNMYIKVLKNHRNILEISEEYIADIRTIFDEFLADIKELNMDSMATNTSVVFHMGDYIYARNKSVRKSIHAVSLAEFISPKMNMVLFYFTGLKDEKSDIPFQGLQDILDSNDKDFIRNILPVLEYTCTYCNVRYPDRINILSHLKEQHCMEQPVLCFKCKKQMNVTEICQSRWNHECQIKTSTEMVAR